MSTSPSMPPLPPSRDEATFSEIIPLRSTKIKLLKSPLLALGLVTAICSVLMFSDIGLIYGHAAGKASVIQFDVDLTVFYLLFLLVWLLHVYSRTDRSVFFYLFPIIVCYLVLTPGPFDLLALIFRKVLPGDPLALPKTAGFVRRFVAFFFAAGLMEELIKASAALFCAYLALRGRVWRDKLHPAIARLLTLRGPLDGMLMGVAAGAYFIYNETAHEYAVRAFQAAYRQSGHNVLVAWGSALTLLLPRTISGITGHMAWAGVFGYFIGLAVIRPNSALKLIGVGWLTAACLHALWDASTSQSSGLLIVNGSATLVVFLACLLKARQIDATMRGGPVDTGGSIIVDEAARPIVAGGQGRPAEKPAVAPVPRQTTNLALAVAGHRLPLAPDCSIDLGAVPALAGRGSGVSGQVIRHPKNPTVLGLRNTGSQSWTVTMIDGKLQEVAPNKNIRLLPGLRIEFADDVVGLVAKS